MNSINMTELLQSYWTDIHLKASLIVSLNILGALLLGAVTVKLVVVQMLLLCDQFQFRIYLLLI
jgi:hypothetical protein